MQDADHFRRDPQLINPRSFRALWPALLWLAAFLFLGDVAVRRIALDTDWIKQTIVNEWKKFRGQEPATASDYMDKLQEPQGRGRRAARPLALRGAADANADAVSDATRARSASRFSKGARSPSRREPPRPP